MLSAQLILPNYLFLLSHQGSTTVSLGMYPPPFIHIKASYAGGLDEGDTLKSPSVLCTRAASWQMVLVVASRRDMNWRNSLGNS